MEKAHEALFVRLGVSIKDRLLYRLALTHPSVAGLGGDPTQNNQRLEFLGDAVLQLVLTTELYARFGSHPEGQLTKFRASLVNRRILGEIGRRLGLGPCMALSRGEDLTGGRDRCSTLADAFEAVIGAVYLDAGYEAAREMILRLFAAELDRVEETARPENPKGELQELIQAKSPLGPEYRVEDVSGPDHDRVFICAVYHSGRLLARGGGKSKKEAESAAAANALTALLNPETLGAPLGVDPAT